jgi:hypothetical protein
MITVLILVDLLASLWRADAKIVWMLTIPDDCKEFQAYFDDIQEKISRISVLDDLLAGNTTNISYQKVSCNNIILPYPF